MQKKERCSHYKVTKATGKCKYREITINTGKEGKNLGEK